MMLNIKNIEYVHETDRNNTDVQYVDVLVHLNDKRTFSITIVTPEYMARHMDVEKTNKTGSNGVCYPNDVDMLVVRDTSERTIEKAIRYMIESNEDLSQFLEISN